VHIKPALQRLHWLPVKARIQFKIATVIHPTLNQRGPAYLNNIIKFNTEESGRHHLRSSTTNAAIVVRTGTQFGKRTFFVCGPSIWNQIPPHIRNLQGRINLYANYAMAWGPPHQGGPRGGRRKKPYTHLYFAIT